jgi:hypothetical protein
MTEKIELSLPCRFKTVKRQLKMKPGVANRHTPFPREVGEAKRGAKANAVRTVVAMLAPTCLAPGLPRFVEDRGVKPYPAEAGIDPGAEIIDPAEGDLAFDERFRAWLKEHLSGEGGDDIVAELVIADETRGLALIRSIADFLRHNRDAKPADGTWSSDAGKQFVTATKAFEKEIGRFRFREEQTHAACQAFIEIAKNIAVPRLGPNIRTTEP